MLSEVTSNIITCVAGLSPCPSPMSSYTKTDFPINQMCCLQQHYIHVPIEFCYKFVLYLLHIMEKRASAWEKGFYKSADISLTIRVILEFEKASHSWVCGQQTQSSNTTYTQCTPFEETPKMPIVHKLKYVVLEFKNPQLSIKASKRKLVLYMSTSVCYLICNFTRFKAAEEVFRFFTFCRVSGENIFIYGKLCACKF